MQCFVYKACDKENHYLYLPQQIEDADLPAALSSLLGQLEFVLEFELTEQRTLPNADSVEVLKQLSDSGYYLQMPRKDQFMAEDRLFN